MIIVKHWPSDWQTLPDVSWSVGDDAAIAQNEPAYYAGYYPPNYQVPAIRYSEELVHWNDTVHYTLMYRKSKTHWAVVGDYPGMSLIF